MRVSRQYRNNNRNTHSRASRPKTEGSVLLRLVATTRKHLVPARYPKLVHRNDEFPWIPEAVGRVERNAGR